MWVLPTIMKTALVSLSFLLIFCVRKRLFQISPVQIVILQQPVVHHSFTESPEPCENIDIVSADISAIHVVVQIDQVVYVFAFVFLPDPSPQIFEKFRLSAQDAGYFFKRNRRMFLHETLFGFRIGIVFRSRRNLVICGLVLHQINTFVRSENILEYVGYTTARLEDRDLA